MADEEMNLVNNTFRIELEKFKTHHHSVKQKVVEIIIEAGAKDWLIEVTGDDEDPLMREYADIARQL